jgi:hypothetical protein
VTNRIDAAMEAMKAAGANPPGDSVGVETCCRQLPVRHDSKLPGRDGRDLGIRGEFLSHGDNKSPHGPVRPGVERGGRPLVPA